MAGRFLAASGPTLLIVVASVLYIPGTSLIVLAVGLALALVVAVSTRHRLHAFIGGLAFAFPIGVITLILFGASHAVKGATSAANRACPSPDQRLL